MATATYDDLWRVNFHAVLNNEEEADHGFWITAESGATAGDLAPTWSLYIPDLLATASTVGVSPISEWFSDEVFWDRMSLRKYSAATGLPSGLALDIGLSEAGTGGTSLPYQCSQAVTWSNGRTIGKRRYNRMFPPPYVSALLTSGGRIAAALKTDWATVTNNFATFAEAQSPASSQCYYSKSDAAFLPLTHMYMDDVIDTQRRRRGRLRSTRDLTVIT